MLELTIFLLTLLTSHAGIVIYRCWSERKGILDVPNVRSSHTTPTPRGGGIVIAGVCLAGYFLVEYLSGSRVSWGYIVGSLLIVGISWLDDLRSISALARLLCHTAAALLIIADAGPIRLFEVPLVSGVVTFGVIAPILTTVWIVWLVNAYNFMDGIDGIAGSQALIAGIGWTFAAFFADAIGVYYFGLIIAAASLGFLLHNWQPAKIFMGDTGSAFLGFTFAALPIIAAAEKPVYSARFALISVIFVWFFLFDSVFTLISRILKGRQVWIPHREHLYQRLIQAGKSHAFVASIYGALTAVLIVLFATGAQFGGNTYLLPVTGVIVLSAGLILYVRTKNLLT